MRGKRNSATSSSLVFAVRFVADWALLPTARQFSKSTRVLPKLPLVPARGLTGSRLVLRPIMLPPGVAEWTVEWERVGAQTSTSRTP